MMSLFNIETNSLPPTDLHHWWNKKK